MVKRICGLGFACLLHICAFSQRNATVRQTATISGNVFLENGQAAAGASVVLENTKLSAEVDDEGHFAFHHLAAGTYHFAVLLVGYDKYNQAVFLKDGEDQSLDILLTHSGSQLPQVMVTAEKRETDLQKTPVAISVIGGQQIEEKKTREVGDLLLSTPNLMTMNIGAPTLSTFSLRGILTFSTQPAVGVYVDGVPMFDGYSSSLQFLNIERVEVLRGPQSTLYGRNALGGIVNVITKKPTNETSGFAEAGISSFGGQRYALGLSGPLVKDKLFMGFSGLYDTRNGYFTNIYDNKKFDRPATYNGNFYLKYLASKKLEFTFNAKGEYNDIRGAFPYSANPDSAYEHPFELDQNGPNREKRKLYTISLNAVYHTKSTEFTSTTAYTRLSDTYKGYDYDYSPYDIAIFEMPLQTQKTLTEDLRMVGNYGEHIKVTAGIFGFIDQKPSQTVFRYGEDAVVMDSLAPYTLNIYGDPHIYGIAGYANLDYSFFKKFTASFGLRYDYERRSMVYATDMVKEPDPPMEVVPQTRIKGHNSAFSPKVALQYNLNRDMMFYGSYTRGYHPGGFNQNTSIPSLLNYKPEYTDNFELGYKSEWFSHRLRANAALFYTNWKDQQQTLQIPYNATENVGHLVNKGAELELSALAAKGLEISYNFGYVHTNYKKLLLPNEDFSGNENFKGNKQIFTPTFNSSLSVAWHYDINTRSSFYFLPEWKYMGKQYMTLYNDLEQKPFSLVNMVLGYRYRNFDVSFWGKNLIDTRYLSFAYATTRADQTQVLLGIPRTLGATLKVSF